MASEDFEIDFSPHTEFTPYQGVGRSDRLAKDGFYALTIKSLTPKKAASGKPMALFAGVVQDEDARGANLVTNILCGGKDKDGNDLGRQFMEFIHAAGTAVEKIQTSAKNGAKAPASQLFAQYIGKTVWARVEADVYEGQETSIISGWVTQEDYEKAKLIGAHRKDRRTVAAGGAVSAAAGALNLGGSANGARPATSSALPNL